MAMALTLTVMVIVMVIAMVMVRLVRTERVAVLRIVPVVEAVGRRVVQREGAAM